MKKIMRFLFFSILAALMTNCTKKADELGSLNNPIKLHFIPSVDAKVIEDNSKIFKIFLEKNTPYKFEIIIPQSFTAVVDAGTNES